MPAALTCPLGVGRIGVERRIEAYQVDAAAGEVAQDVETVTVVEGVGGKADVHSFPLFRSSFASVPESFH